MADAVSLAQDLWDLGQSDPTVLGELRKERKAFVMSLAKGEIGGDIVSGSKNGSSYTMRPGYTVNDRRTALSLAIYGLEIGIRPSRTCTVRF